MLPAPLAEAPSLRTSRSRVAHEAAWISPRNVVFRSHAETARLVLGCTVLVASLVAIGLTHVWFAAQSRELGYDRMAAHGVVRRLEIEARDLEAKVESLNRHDRIERIARDRLGMVRPVAGQRQELP